MVITALALAILLADVDHNGVVDSRDSTQVVSHLGEHGRWDVNQNGVVDIMDFVGVINLWKAGWGIHASGDGKPWFIGPGRVLGVGPSPFPHSRRLTFLDQLGGVVAIDFPAPSANGDASHANDGGEDEDDSSSHAAPTD